MSRFRNAVVRGTAAAVIALAAVAQPIAAGADSDEPKTTEDPLEKVNRVTSEFNRLFRGVLLDPLVDGYQAVTPEPMQKAISNAASNLNEPVTAVSSLLQGDEGNAKAATSRFLINSTVGLGGVGDPAADFGYTSRAEDLGQAAGAGGTEAGPHIVLPLLGPSNVRDLTGDVITGLISPLPLVGAAAKAGVTYADNQDEINSISRNALDPYLVEREAYEQHRRYLINNGEAPLMEMPSLDGN